jgi:hypothetical protein
MSLSSRLLGGSFTSVNGTPATNIAEISTTTGTVVPTFGDYANGKVDTLLGYQDHLVYNQQLSHGGTLDLVEGNFISVDGQPREQIFMLNLAASTGLSCVTVSPVTPGSASCPMHRSRGCGPQISVE